MTKKEFEDEDNDAAAEAANKAAVDKIRAAKEGASEEAETTDRVEVDLDQADEELEDKSVAGEARESRLERRRNRYRELQERQTAAERRAEEAEKRYQQMFEVMQRAQVAQQPQQPQQPQVDPLEEEWRRITAEQDYLYREYNAKQAAGQCTPQDFDAYSQKAREVQRRMIVTASKMAMREEGVQRGPDEKQIRATILAERLHQEHSDVLQDERKRMFADAVWRQMLATGEQDSWETICKAMEQTRRQFGMKLKNPPKPSEGYKSKLSGMSRGAGAGGSDRHVVTMGPAEKRMANAMFAHLPDQNERYKRWAATAGAKAQNKKTG